MAIKDVPLTDIVDNPFQPRSTFDKATIQSLAEEIEAEGFWNGALQGRRNAKGQIELVYGHRRLRALRRLKKESVRIEILPLTDAQMALRSLEENLQREGLTELERADAVVRAVEMQQQALIKDENLLETKAYSRAVQLIAMRLGFQEPYIYELCQFTRLTSKTRGHVESGAIAVQTAYAAEQWGGTTYVQTLAKQGKEANRPDARTFKPTRKTVSAMKRAVQQAPESVREKLQEKIWAGEVKTPEDAERKGTQLAAAKARHGKLPPQDLRAVIIGWTHDLKEWNEKLEAVIPYMDYVDEVPQIADEFRKQLRRHIEICNKLLKASQ